MQLNFVIPGWYKTTSGGDSFQTIRVLGESDDKPNYFKLADGKELPEYEILNNWEYMPTSPTQNANDEQFSVGDLNTVSNNHETVYEDVHEEYDTEIDDTHTFTHTTDATTNKVSPVLPKEKPISKDEIFVNELLQQISIDNDIEKFGEIKFKTSFSIPINFNFDFDLNKLKSLINIMNVSDKKLNIILDQIISKNSKNIDELIRTSLKTYIKNTETQIKTEPLKIEEDVTINDKKTDNNILSSYLNNF